MTFKIFALVDVFLEIPIYKSEYIIVNLFWKIVLELFSIRKPKVVILITFTKIVKKM